MNSSSSSSSSSSWLSFGSKTQTLGCISLFLQRFLCSRSSSSSTYPYDQITEFDLLQPGYTGNHRRVNSSVEYVELQDDNFFILSFENDTSHEQEKRRERRDNQRETEKSWPLQTQIECKKNNKNALNALLGRETLGIGELKLRRKEKAKKRRKRRENIQKEAEETQTLQTQTECEENNKNDSNAFSGRETLEIGELKLRRKEKRKKRRKRRENIQKETEKSQPLQMQTEFKVNNKNASNASSGYETLKAVSPKKRQNTTDKFLSKELSYGESKDRDLVNCEEEEECGSSQDLSPVSVLDFENTSRTQLSKTIQEDHITVSTSRWSEYHEMWLMICKITDSEIKESNWVNGKASKPEDLEEIISEDIVSQLLDQLVEETITNTFS